MSEEPWIKKVSYLVWVTYLDAQGNEHSDSKTYVQSNWPDRLKVIRDLVPRGCETTGVNITKN